MRFAPQTLPNFTLGLSLQKRVPSSQSSLTLSAALVGTPGAMVVGPRASPTDRTIVTGMAVSAVPRSGLVHASLLSRYSVCRADTLYQQAGNCADFILKSMTLDRKKNEHIFFGGKNNLKLLMLKVLGD